MTPRRPARWEVIGACAWTLSIAFFIVQAIAQAASSRPFSLKTNLISDLGNTQCGVEICSPLHGLVNATFIAVGLVHWFGATTRWSAWPGTIRVRAGLVSLSLAGWGLAYAGVFPENVAPVPHGFGALLGLVSLNVGMELLGSGLRSEPRILRGALLVSGAIGLLGLGFFLAGQAWVPPGISERIADYPSAAMFVVLGLHILSRSLGLAGQGGGPGRK